jgi:anti-sigma B factor antagonist
MIELATQSAEIGPDEYVLTVTGEVDSYSAHLLQEALSELFEAGADAIVIDLRPVTFLDSTGLGVITAAVKRARADQRTVVLACDGPEALRIFQVTGLDRFISIRPSLASAIDEVRGKSA